MAKMNLSFIRPPPLGIYGLSHILVVDQILTADPTLLAICLFQS